MKHILSFLLVFTCLAVSAGVPIAFNYCRGTIKSEKGSPKQERKSGACEKSSEKSAGIREDLKAGKEDVNDANSFLKYLRNHFKELNNLKCDSFRFKEKFFPINNTLLKINHFYLNFPLPVNLCL